MVFVCDKSITACKDAWSETIAVGRCLMLTIIAKQKTLGLEDGHDRQICSVVGDRNR